MIARFEGLTVRYGSIVALDGVTGSVPEGAVGLLGPNGAGKSTLLKTLLGFLTPVSGTATVLGHDASREAMALRARVGYMPEVDAWLPGLNAVGMVTLAGELGGLTRTESMSRSHEVLSYVGLTDARYREVSTYSTGMRARVKLAQALVADPDLLLLDEPTNGLDPQGRSEMLGLIHDIQKRLGIHVLLSSHLLPDVEEVCEHVLLVHQARLVVAAPIRELKALSDKSYEVALSGDVEAFRRALASEGGEVEPLDQDFLVRVPGEKGTDPILRAAVATGAVLRRLVRRERTLAEVFVEAVQSGAAART